jgi:hypothetical protein
MKTPFAPLCQKKAQNRATIIGIQGNCQMENRSLKLQEYWKNGVIGKWVGERALVSCGMLIVLPCAVIARSGSDEAICLDNIRKTRLLHFVRNDPVTFNNLMMARDGENNYVLLVKYG